MKEKGLTKQDSSCIKGIAINVLLFYHLFRLNATPTPYNISYFPFGEGFIVNFAEMCRICVSLFAFISGFGLLLSIKNTEQGGKALGKWTVSRMLKTMSRFYVIYILSFIVTWAINSLPKTTYFGEGVKLTNGILNIALDFLGLSSIFGTPILNGTWWYMGAALLYIALIPIIYSISKKFGYIGILSVVVALPYVLTIGFLGGRNMYTFLPAFILGMFFADKKVFEKISEKLPENSAAAYIICFVVFGGLCVISYFISKNLDYQKLWFVPHTFIVVSFICFFRYCIIRIPVIKQILDFLGKHSMTIFLTHTFMMDFVYSFKNFIKIYAVLFALSLALAFVIDLVLDLIKYDKFFSKLTDKITSIV